MVSRSIERAQSNVEQQNFEIRKNVLKYDDVLNTQRHVIYAERTQLLEGEEFAEHAKQNVEDVILSTVDTYANAEMLPEEWDLAGLIVALEEIYPTKVHKEDLDGRSFDEVRETVLRDLNVAYAAKETELGAETMRRAERLVFLNVLDAAWRDHLYEMDYLREGIGLRAMGQRDPLVEYQREGYELFQNVIGRIRDDFARYIFHVSTVKESDQMTRRSAPLKYTAPATTSQAGGGPIRRAPAAPAAQPAEPVAAAGGPPPPPGAPEADEVTYETIRREGDKVGRNDPCPCGSGKKYKRCHGMV
jgi:preprotein translocase subunit SecA